MHRCKLVGGVALVALLLAGNAEAQAGHDGKSQKPAWKWSLDERIDQRFDSHFRKARAEQAAEASKRRNSFDQFQDPFFDTAKSGRSDIYSIDGQQTPELLLPFELFNSLLGSCCSPGGEGMASPRRRIEEGATALGFGSDFWDRLEKAAAPLLSLEREDFRRAMADRSGSKPEIELKMASQEIRLCRARANALAAAKAEFGEEPFLRLLYEVIAPSMSIDYIDKEGLPNHLRYIQGGCK